MTTYTASAAQANQPAIYVENGAVTRYVEWTTSASASVGDVVQLVKVPQGAIITSLRLSCSLSAGVITGNLGDGNDTSAYAADLALSGAGVQAVQLINFRGLGRSYSAEDTIDFVVTGVSTPAANAALKLLINYTCQNGG